VWKIGSSSAMSRIGYSGNRLLHAALEFVVLGVAVELVGHEEAAAETVFAQRLALLIR